LYGFKPNPKAETGTTVEYFSVIYSTVVGVCYSNFVLWAYFMYRSLFPAMNRPVHNASYYFLHSVQAIEHYRLHLIRFKALKAMPEHYYAS